jgi:integrase
MRRSLNNLQRVLRLAVESKPAPYLRENPFKGWEKPEVEEGGAPRYLLEDEERRLRIALIERDDKARTERVKANDWRRARGYDRLPEFAEKEFTDHVAPMVLISLNTGLRYGELASLEWASIDLQACSLTVTGRTAKSAKTRHVPLNAEAIDMLTRWRPEKQRKGLVFTNPNGSRIGSVKTAWGGVLKAAGITEFRWHDLRHSFASKLVQRGVALPVVRELLGHGDFKLTLRYAHLDDKQKIDAVARLAA